MCVCVRARVYMGSITTDTVTLVMTAQCRAGLPTEVRVKLAHRQDHAGEDGLIPSTLLAARTRPCGAGQDRMLRVWGSRGPRQA